MTTYNALFRGRKIGAHGLMGTHRVYVDFESDSGPVGRRGEAWDALVASGAYDTHEHFQLVAIGEAKRNREGLTYVEWMLASQQSDSTTTKRAWLAGVDPSASRRARI